MYRCVCVCVITLVDLGDFVVSLVFLYSSENFLLIQCVAVKTGKK